MVDTQKIWDAALAEIELGVSKASFGTWFRHTRILKYDSGTICLGVPNAFVRDWLANKYHKFILKALRELSPDVRALDYSIVKQDAQAKLKKAEEASRPSAIGQMDFSQELYINREDNLNPKYVFETFIVGSFNELAHAATQAVLKKVGLVYNPLFIYGGTGLGKTHLLQAVGNQIKKQHPNKKVFYTSGEQFMVDYVNSVRANKVNIFKERYRKYDVLIMDDIQFLSNKDKTQEELFHLFNNFYENNKQIIFSSDKPPNQIQYLEDRLKSRLAGGMMADIAKPDYESRVAILSSKIKQLPYQFDDEGIQLIAGVVQDSIRELEGCLNTILCQCQIKNRALTAPELKILLKHNVKPKRTISVTDLANVVASFYNISEKMLYEKTRKKEVVKPRQVIMYLLREDFNTSYPTIGHKLGDRDHTTVIHACEKIKKELKEDVDLSHEIEKIRELLYN